MILEKKNLQWENKMIKLISFKMLLPKTGKKFFLLKLYWKQKKKPIKKGKKITYKSNSIVTKNSNTTLRITMAKLES